MRKTAGAVGLLAIALCGCSQIAALAPPGGKGLATVRFAANDVLVSQHVAILTAPVCAQSSTAITCDGMTLGNEAITVTAGAAPDPDIMDVTVASRTIFHGSVQDVLNASARATS